VTSRLSGLDGLRGVAALIVVALHVAECMGWRGFGHGYLLVDLFFLLSGFVLSAGYGERLTQGGAGGWFFGRRLLRLYPLAIVGLALGFSVSLALAARDGSVMPAAAPAMLAVGALFLPWLGGGLISPYNGPAWSLQLELWINALYGACARWLTDRRLAALAGAAALALAAAALAAGQFDGGFANNDPSRSAGPASYLVGWARVLFSFPLGILLHRLWLRGAFPTLSVRSVWPAPAALLLIALPVPGVSPAYDLAVVFAVLPVLLILSANAKPSVAAAALFAHLGRLSYGLYVLHGPILVAFHYLAPAGGPALRLAWYGLAVVISLCAAALAERFIDRPARRWSSQRGAMRGARLVRP
jgi:peptidoglycan/LPS O-acetylase OafA/YrhL